MFRILCHSLFVFALFTLLLVGCSGGDGIDGTGETPETVSGTAAEGKAIANAIIVLKDATGRKKQSRTSTTGHYSFDVKDMTPPFFVRVDVDDNSRYFSFAPGKGIANIHQYSDVTVRNWFTHRDRNIEAEFEDDNQITDPPLKDDIDKIKSVFIRLLAAAYENEEFNLDTDFDFISDAFNANEQGFDKLLHNSIVSVKNNKLTIELKDPETGLAGKLVFEFDFHDDLAQADTESPTNPSNLLAVAANSKEIVLVWDSSTDNVGVGGYYVYRNNSVDPSAKTPYPVFRDTELSPGTQYCYTIQAFDAEDNRSEKVPLANEQQLCATTLEEQDQTPPLPPVLLSAEEVTRGSIEVRWDAPAVSDDIIGYYIYRGNGGPVDLVNPIAAVGQTARLYVDYEIDDTTVYCYRLTAFDAALNESDPSSEICPTRLPIISKPIAPSVNPVASITNQSTVSISGATIANGEVTILGGASDVTTTASATGVFDVVVSLSLNTVNSLSVFVTDGSNGVSDAISSDVNGKPLAIVQDSTPPEVTSIVPSDAASDISISTQISITFNEEIDSNTITAANFELLQGVTAVPGQLSRASGTTVVFHPDGPLDYLSSYNVQLNSGGISDLAGNQYTGTFTSMFTTAAANSNTVPVADAGLDQIIVLGGTAYLNGSGSFDQENDTLTYAWTLVQQPLNSLATIVNPTSATPTLVSDVDGVYIFQLVVNDGSLYSDPDEVVVRTMNGRPIANSGPDQSVGIGDTVTLDGSGSSDPENAALTYQWSLSTPVASSATLSDVTAQAPTFQPDVDGHYIAQLIVSDGVSHSAVDYAVVTVGTTSQPQLACGSLTNASISAAAETDLYSFQGTAGDQINIALVQTLGFSGTQAHMTLYSPGGAVVNGTSYVSNTQRRFTLTETGTYVIRVVANNLVGTGDYALALECLTEPASIQGTLIYGDLITGTIDAPAEIDLYMFEGGADEQINLALVQTLGFSGTRAHMTLFSPSGVVVTNTSYEANTQRRFTLPETGTYVIRVLASNLVGTGTYALGLERLTPPASIQGTLVYGDLIASTIDAPAESDLYTFEGVTDEQINLALVQTVGFSGTRAHMTLFSPSGVVVTNTSYEANTQRRFTLPETGTYVIRVLASDLVGTGTYALGLERLTPPASIQGTLVYGDLITGTIDAPAESDLYTFEGVTDEQINLALVQTIGFSGTRAHMTLFSPSGVVVTNTGYEANTQRRFTLPETGTYVIRVLASNLVGTGTYALGMERLTPPAAIQGTLVYGDLITGTIDTPAESDLYTFEGVADEQINMALVQTAGFSGTRAHMTLFSPSGVVVTNTGYEANTQRRFTLPETGTYVIRVLASNLVGTGTYALGLERLIPPASIQGTLAYGDLITGTIDAPAESDLYTFSGADGNIITISIVQTDGFTGTNANLTLYSPSGVVVNGTSYNANSQPQFTLTETGIYVIRVLSSNLVGTGAYSLGLNQIQ
jgi:hypothetical protein